MAKDVKITDSIESDKLSLVKDSIVIKDQNGKDLSEADVEVNNNSFSIDTHHSLKYKEYFNVYYEALINDEITEESDVLNIAGVSISNGENSSTKNSINIVLTPAITKEEKEEPQEEMVLTGDNTSIPIYLLYGGLSMIGILLVGVKIYRKRNN